MIFKFDDSIVFQWKFLTNNISFMGISIDQRHSSFFDDLGFHSLVSSLP